MKTGTEVAIQSPFLPEKNSMKVRDLMTTQVASCRPEDDLGRAGTLMWENDCGIIPVVEDGRVTGVITDRDICVALVTRGIRASEASVRDAMTREVRVCREDDDVKEALKSMAEQQIRRLPVVDREGRLTGIVSLNDAAVRANDAKRGNGIAYKQVAETLKAVCGHRQPAHTSR